MVERFCPFSRTILFYLPRACPLSQAQFAYETCYPGKTTRTATNFHQNEIVKKNSGLMLNEYSLDY